MRAYEDRTFDFEVRQPNSSYFIRKAAELEKGASNPGHEVVGRLSVKKIYEIAQARRPAGKCCHTAHRTVSHSSLWAQCKSSRAASTRGPFGSWPFKKNI